MVGKVAGRTCHDHTYEIRQKLSKWYTITFWMWTTRITI